MAGDYSDLDQFPATWELKRIGDFASVKGGKRLPAGTALVPTRTNHPYLRIVDFKDRGIDKSGLMFVPDDVFHLTSPAAVATSKGASASFALGACNQAARLLRNPCKMSMGVAGMDGYGVATTLVAIKHRTDDRSVAAPETFLNSLMKRHV